MLSDLFHHNVRWAAAKRFAETGNPEKQRDLVCRLAAWEARECGNA